MRRDAFLAACVLAVTVQPTTWAASSVQAVTASTGRVAIYVGTADGTDLEYIGASPVTPADVPAPPTHVQKFEVEDGQYLYVTVWGVDGPAGGLLAELFFNGIPIRSGDPAWEVYPTTLHADRNAAPPSTSLVGRQVLAATRRYAWQKAAVVGANGISPAGTVVGISEEAAWMWNPPEDAAQDAAPPTMSSHTGGSLLFRLSPTELWPEIELWHGRNVGDGPQAGPTFNDASAGGGPGGLRSGGGGGGAVDGRSGSRGVRGVPNPFPDYRPPNSSSIPPVMTPSVPSTPIIPPRENDLDTPVNITTSDDPPTPPEDDPPPSDPPPVEPPQVPEPSAGLLMSLGAAGLLRRR